MNIMFICTGNICRSAMAQWLLVKKLEDLKKQCCKELKILNEKIEKSQKNKKGYYELFIIENDLNFEFELMERNIKNDEERALWEIKKNEFDELRRELAEIRGEVLD